MVTDMCCPKLPLGVVKGSGANVSGGENVVLLLCGVAESVEVARVPEGPHAGIGVERRLQPGRVADRLDLERRGEHPTMQEQGVAHAPRRAGGDDPDIHEHHSLGAAPSGR
jgi:hypothetical protein